MIELKVQDRCHNCKYFKPKAMIYTRRNDVNTVIVCKRKGLCENLYTDLEERYSDDRK